MRILVLQRNKKNNKMGVIDDNFENEEFEEAMYGMLRDEVEHAKIKDKKADIKANYKKIEEMKEKLAFSTNWDNSNTNSTIGVVEEPFPCDIAPKQELTSTKEQAKKDNVNHPQHYNQGGIECFDVIKAFYGQEAFEGFCAGNMLKYAMRYRHKGQALDDLKKIRFYADELIKMYESTNKE